MLQSMPAAAVHCEHDIAFSLPLRPMTEKLVTHTAPEYSAMSEQSVLEQSENVTIEANISFGGIFLPLGIFGPVYHSFSFPVNENIPPFAARAPGKSFISLIAPLIIQPNAP
ncbi:hypothetical protein [Rufibacter roseus]|uniref:Uncharacterized protein n=2 Tax=Rufibacter roseus TaxID=1567108 RepID=A0ABW2DF30_9BACT